MNIGPYITEGKKDFEIYHKSYTKTIDEVLAYIKKNGYHIDEDEYDNEVAFGERKPAIGKTVRKTLPLWKRGEKTKRKVHFQVYGMDSGKYELNLYIS
tara:strand:- start:25 stop:318 length:294 start_codon:yes stop_codon:yes gene_type:complete